MNTIAKPCLICGEGQLEPRVGKNRVEYEGVARELDLHFSVCSACGSEQSDAVQMRENKRAMTRFRKEVDGLLTGREVRALRETLGINQSEATLIFGGGPVAFSKYEADDITQSEGMDKLLRVAQAVPQAYAHLRRLAGLPSQSGDWVKVESPKAYAGRPKLGLVYSTVASSRIEWRKQA